MPLYSDSNYYYTGGSSQLYSPYYTPGGYSGPTVSNASSYSPYTSTYNRAFSGTYSVPLTPPRTPTYTSSHGLSSRYQPKLSTITETSPLISSARHSTLMPLTRISSPKFSAYTSPSSSTSLGPKYIPPRPILINTANIDVSSQSRYRKRREAEEEYKKRKEEEDREYRESEANAFSPSSSTKRRGSIEKNDKNEKKDQKVKSDDPPLDLNNNDKEQPQSDTSSTERRPARSTIKRNRAVVRLSTIRSRSKDRSSKSASTGTDETSTSPEPNEKKFKDLPRAPEGNLGWRQKLADDLAAIPAYPLKKSPGDLMRERYLIQEAKAEETDTTTVSRQAARMIPVDDEPAIDQVVVELDPLDHTIRRLSIPQCPTFHDICEDISSDKIDDDLNAGELRRRASVIQEQEIELLNQLQKSASGTFQLIHLERQGSQDSLNDDSQHRQSTSKRKSKSSKKIRHKITAIVEVENSPPLPILKEEDLNTPAGRDSKPVPKFTFNVEDVEEHHEINKVFKLPKKKSIKKAAARDVAKEVALPEGFVQAQPKAKSSPTQTKVLPKKETFISTAEIFTFDKASVDESKTEAELEKPKREEVYKDFQTPKTPHTVPAIVKDKDQDVSTPKVITPTTKPIEEVPKPKINEKVPTPSLQLSTSLDSSFNEPITKINPKILEKSQSLNVEEAKFPAILTKPKLTSVLISKTIQEEEKPLIEISKSEEIKTSKVLEFTPKTIASTKTITPALKSSTSLDATTPSTPKSNSKLLEKSQSLSVEEPKAPAKVIKRPVQKSESGEDFWSQIGSRESLYMTNRKKNLVESQWPKSDNLLESQTEEEVQYLEEIKTVLPAKKEEAPKKLSPKKKVEDKKVDEVKLEKKTSPKKIVEVAKKVEEKKVEEVKLEKKIAEVEKKVDEKKVEEEVKLEKKKTSPKKIVEIEKKLDEKMLNEVKKTIDAEKKILDKKTEEVKKKTSPTKVTSPKKTVELPKEFAKSAKTDTENAKTTAILTPATTKAAELSTTTKTPKINTGQEAKSPEQQPNKFTTTTATTPTTTKTTIASNNKDKTSINIVTTTANAKISELATTSTNSTALTTTTATAITTAAKQQPETKAKQLTEADKKSGVDLKSPTHSANAGDKAKLPVAKPKVAAVKTSKVSPKGTSPSTVAAAAAASAAKAATAINTDQFISVAPPAKKVTSPIKTKNASPSAAAVIKTTKTTTVATTTTTTTLTAPTAAKTTTTTLTTTTATTAAVAPSDTSNSSGSNNLSKFATVSNLAQCLADVDADLEDYIPSSAENSDYTDDSSDNYSSANGCENLSASMKKKLKQRRKKEKREEKARFDPKKKVTIDPTNKCYVKEEAPRYPLVATPRPLWKREKIVYPSAETDDSDSDESGSTEETEDSEECTTSEEYEDDVNTSGAVSPAGGATGSSTASKENSSSIIRMSTCSNDSGFEGGTAPSSPKKMLECDVNCHKKCERLTANLCGVNQKLIVEALAYVKRGAREARDSPSTPPSLNPAYKIESNEEQDETSYTYSQFQKSGRFTAPATVIPRFKNYTVDDFHFLAVLGKGSFGKVLLAELRDTTYYYAVKCLKKDVVLEDDDVDSTLIERKVLALGTKHPYLCHLFCTFQTESHLFFVMEYLNGGDLMFHIQESGRFSEERARFYGAEIISGLKFLHKKGIIYRDLKLDNVLLDYEGHVRIADFGMCKLQIYLDKTADSFCGTPDYMAPEIVKGEKYNQNVDWWSFGVLLYEMLIGQSPFSGCDEDELFWSICNEIPWFPVYISAEATSILKGLLEKDFEKRVGSQYSPAGDISDHIFFRPIDWNMLDKRQMEPPFKPQVKHPLDTQYFDRVFTRERVRLTPIDKEILQSMDQKQFHGFTYTNPHITLD